MSDKPQDKIHERYENQEATHGQSSFNTQTSEKMPWDVDGIKSRLLPEDAGIYYNLDNLPDSAIADLNTVLKNIASLPADVSEILRVLKEPTTSSSSVGDACRNSVAISAMILKVVNSAAFGLSRQIDALCEAVTYIGFDELRTLVLAMSLMNRKPKRMDVMDINKLWEHSIASSKLVAWVDMQTLYKGSKSLRCTGSMLRGIGKVLLLWWRPDKFSQALRMSKEENISLMEAETRILGLTHAQAGAFIAEKWNLSPKVQYILKGCNRPEIDPDCQEIAMVFLAGQIARVMFGYDDGEPAVVDIDEKVRELLKFSENTVTGFCHTDSFYEFALENISKKLLFRAQ